MTENLRTSCTFLIKLLSATVRQMNNSNEIMEEEK